MANLRNFFNEISGNNRIFTGEDIGQMSGDEFAKNEKAIRHQWGSVGIPSEHELSGSDDVVYVRAYTRGDGTKVSAYYRSKGGRGGNIDGSVGTIESAGGTSNINQAVTDVTDVFNILSGFIPEGLLGNVGSFLGDYYENLTNISHKNGNPTGAAAGVNGDEKPNLGDNLQESIYNSLGTLTTGSVAKANMNNAIHDMAASKKNPFAKIITRDNIKNSELNKLLDNIGVPKNSRGSFYTGDSSQSKQLSESKQINDFIKNNYEKIRNNEIKNAPVHFNSLILRGADNYAGIQHAIIHNPKIDNDGNFSGMIVDYYDFTHRTGLHPGNIPNNWGYSMQQRGLLENQFNIYFLYKKLK
uniref:Uncharacterized protein n=1 Tax=uncultured Candidatus Melainabacteria bacterium TaxID=2682970 RepID=A0A650F2F5_9BACT|nr:hypothetical protein Melaina855_2220 [uncultured Candidatus Melainabacteria bacterium]